VIRLLGRKTSGNVQKVLVLLEELGIPYEREDYGRQFGNTQDEKYLSLNPNGKVPTLIDGKTTIWESNSILRYLAATNGNKFYAADPASRSLIDRWMDWQLASLDPAFLAIFRDMRNPPEQRSAQFAANVTALGETLAILDRGMGQSDWVAGANPSIADFCLAPAVHRCLGFGVDLPALPQVRRWHNAITSRPSFATATK
jgi:glutathione S-transferase